LRGKRTERRYDPLDLTRLAVWHKDVFLDPAEPEEIATTNDPELKPC
jgi:hypothetical protein